MNEQQARELLEFLRAEVVPLLVNANLAVPGYRGALLGRYPALELGKRPEAKA